MKMSVWLAVACLLIGAQSQAQAQNAYSDTEVRVDNSRLYTPMNAEDQDTMNPDFGGPGGGGHPGGGGGFGPHPGPGGGGGFGPHPGPGPMPHPGPGPGPMPHPGPGPGHGPWGGHPGWHPGGPRPGWHNGWQWDHNQRPGWWYGGIAFPGFAWATQVPNAWYQCTAFDSEMNAYSATAPDIDEAAYDALYDCGGADYQDECYIPDQYCRQFIE